MLSLVNPKVSVIVPVYNVSAYLPECLYSLKNQTYENIEVLIIDDGSTDESGKICHEFSSKDSRFFVVHTENHGLSAARNRALEIASGEYVGFVDSDDVCEEFMFESLVSAAIENNADIVFGAKRNIFQGKLCNARLSPYPNQLISKAEFCKAIISEKPWRRNACAGGYVWLKLFKKEVLNGLSFISTDLCCEDELFCMSASKKADRIYSLNKEIYRYRQRKSSVVRDSRMSLKLLIGRLKIYQLIKRDKSYGRSRKILKNNLLTNLRENGNELIPQMKDNDLKEIRKFIKEMRSWIAGNYSMRDRMYFRLFRCPLWFLRKFCYIRGLFKKPTETSPRKLKGELFD